jgi:hypothetical protein
LAALWSHASPFWVICSSPRASPDFLEPRLRSLFATLSLTVLKDGNAYAQTEARSMIVGAIAFFIYALCVSRLLVRHKLPAFAVTASSILTWMAAAFGLWYAVLR